MSYSEKHENDSDLTNQQEVMRIITDWFQKLPAIGDNGEGFSHAEIPTDHTKSTPDFRLFWNGKCVGVVEIKCRTSSYDTWMISRGKLKSLYNNYQTIGFPAILAFSKCFNGVADEIYLADLRHLVANKDKWQEASDEMTQTTNHGQGQRIAKDRCYLLPVELFWRVI